MIFLNLCYKIFFAHQPVDLCWSHLIIAPAFFFHPPTVTQPVPRSRSFHLTLNFHTQHTLIPSHPPKTVFKIFKNPITHRWRRSCEIPHSPHSHIFPAHHHYRRVVISCNCHGAVVSLLSSPSCRTKGCVFIVDSRGVAMQHEIRALKKIIKHIWWNVCDCSDWKIIFKSYQWQCIPEQIRTYFSLALIFVAFD